MPQNTIEQTLTVNAPAEKVYRALTEPSELRRWFATEAKSDARTGGAYHLTFTFDDASRNHETKGEYRAAEAGKRVAYSWPAGHAKVPTEVEFKLAPQGNGTELTMLHSGWAATTEESRKEHEMGWGFFLSNLKAYLEEGKDQRSAALGMKTAAAV
jgi:uncharacterized protein YndB with AHSA1/START domain